MAIQVTNMTSPVFPPPPPFSAELTPCCIEWHEKNSCDLCWCPGLNVCLGFVVRAPDERTPSCLVFLAVVSASLKGRSVFNFFFFFLAFNSACPGPGFFTPNKDSPFFPDICAPHNAASHIQYNIIFFLPRYTPSGTVQSDVRDTPVGDPSFLLPFLGPVGDTSVVGVIQPTSMWVFVVV